MRTNLSGSPAFSFTSHLCWHWIGHKSCSQRLVSHPWNALAKLLLPQSKLPNCKHFGWWWTCDNWAKYCYNKQISKNSLFCKSKWGLQRNFCSIKCSYPWPSRLATSYHMDSFTKAFTKVAASECTGGKVSKESSQRMDILNSLSLEVWV